MLIKNVAHQFFGWQLAAAVIGFACLGSGSTAVAMPMGFASLNGGTTGGAGGPTVVATTSGQFQTFATQSGALNIMVDGTLNVGGVEVASDKTIMGVGSTGELIGSLQFDNVSNVIVRNLWISNPNDDGEGDAITLRESSNVWFDHNNVSDAPDGLLDIVSESDFVTVSWNKFFYTSDYATNVNTNHRFAMLIGNSDSATEDADNLRVTLYNNHWGENVRERMPRVRYGEVHVFNEYVNSPGNNYVVRSALEAEVLVENSYLENVDDPLEKQQTGLVEESGNLFINTTGSTDDGDNVFDPSYSYFLHAAADVKDLVLGYAGVGRLGDFDGNGTRDGRDFLLWQQGNSPLPLSRVDLTDWEANYGDEAVMPNSAMTTAVPEPSALLLGWTALLSGIVSSRRR